tara:strand:- start:4287 stop:16886 length:12600 start_codon:yes stop_codon:yes gene_type:complete
MVFLSNYLVFKIVLAALGRTDYPVAGDLELKYDNANKVYLSGGSLKYVDDVTLWSTIGEETSSYDSVESLNLDISNEKILLADDRDTNTQLGYGCDIDGDYMIGGGPQDDEGGSQAGAAYIFKRNGTSWKQTAKLVASDAAANDQAAEFCEISGDYAIYGAYSKNSNTGAAYIFKRDTGAETWSQQAKLTASDAASSDYFGWGVSIDGDYAIVGAYGEDTGAGQAGAAYIFKRSGTSWSQEAKIQHSSVASSDYFGYDVTISGDYAAVGAIYQDTTASSAGSVYIFKRSGTSWTQQQQIQSSDVAANDNFGCAVAMDGDYLAVSSPYDNSNYGAVYFFKKDTGAETWTQQTKIIPSDVASNDQAGNIGRLSISGDTVVMGSDLHDSGGMSDSGAAWVFKRSGATWSEVKKLSASDAVASDRFGISVGVSGNTILVGAAYNDVDGVTHAGALYVYNSQKITNYYITDAGKYSADVTIAGLKYKTNEVDVTSLNIPAKVVGISAGSAQVAALTSDGYVYMWGTGSEGRLGQGSGDVGNKNTPVQVKGVGGSGFLSNIKQISCGGTQTLALANDGTLYAWGSNSEGQLGVGDTTARYYPTVVPYTGEAISKIAAIHKHSLICTVTNGYVYACGENQSGQIGDGTSGSNRNTFTQVKGVGGSGNISGITHLSGGNDFSMILNATTGLAYGFGRGNEYQLSTGDNTSTNTTPRNVKTGGSSTNLTGITDISCGEDFSYFLKSDGTVYASGEGSAGEQGDGANSDNTSATQCTGLSGISNILGTKTCGFARKSDGTLYVWGDNTHGQFASGSETSGDTHTPTEITSITGVEDIQSYGRGTHLIARKSDGSVFCWGEGNNGQIGNGVSNAVYVPTQVIPGAGPSVDGKFNLLISPRLSFDGYNKLSILHGLKSLSSSLFLSSNTYNIGALTSDLTIETPGLYKSLTYDTFSGAAYFNKTTVGAIASTMAGYEVESIIPGYGTTDSWSQGGFGSYMDFSGDGTRMVTGMGMYNISGQYDGRAAVYHLENGTWVQKVDLASTNTGHTRFGDSVCMSDDGTRIAVDFHPNSTIKIYDYASGAWPTSPTVSISGTQANGDMDMNKAGTVIVRGEGEGGNKAYIYTRAANGTWSETKQWSGFTGLGNGVSINGAGTRVLIGQRNASGSSPNYVGKVYEANYDGSSWGSITEVYASSANTNNWPTRIRMDDDGTTAVIMSGTDGQGRILERQSGTSWTSVMDVQGRCSFYSRGSSSISYDGNMVLTGDNYYTPSGVRQGRAFLYEYSGGSWSLTKTYENPKTTPAADDGWGYGTAIAKNSKDRFAIGMSGDGTYGSEYGSVYVYTNAIPDYISFDTYNKLTLSGLTNPTSKIHALPTGAESTTTYDIGTATNIYIDSAGTYTAEMKGSSAFAIDSNVVNAVSSTILPILKFENLGTSLASNVSGVNLVSEGSNTAPSHDSTNNAIQTANPSSLLCDFSSVRTSTTSDLAVVFETYYDGASGLTAVVTLGEHDGNPNTDFSIDQRSSMGGTIGGLSIHGKAYVIDTSLSGGTYQATAGLDAGDYKDKWSKHALVHYEKDAWWYIYVNGEWKLHMSSSQTTTSEVQDWFSDGFPSKIRVFAYPGQYTTGGESTGTKVRNIEIYDDVSFIVSPAPKLDFDGFNKYTFPGADTGSTYKLKYGSNTYDLGTVSTVYIKDAGTYSGEIKGATNFALVSNVASVISSGVIANPVFTSATAITTDTNWTSGSGWEITEDSTASAAKAGWKVFDNIWTNSETDNQWETDGVDVTTSNPAWVQIKYPSAYKAVQYSIQPKELSTPKYPKTWKFQGSNDGGTSGTWVDLDTQTDKTDWAGNNTVMFTGLSTSTAYQYFRLYITDTDGSAGCIVRELKVYTLVSGSQVGNLPLPDYTYPTTINLDSGQTLSSASSLTIANESHQVSGGKWYRLNHSSYTSDRTVFWDNAIGGWSYYDTQGNRPNHGWDNPGGVPGKLEKQSDDDLKLEHGSNSSSIAEIKPNSSSNPWPSISGSPSLTFDTYDKLSISGITPTSTKLTSGENTYDIGTATNIYITENGTYDAEVTSASVFALTSNVVGSINEIDTSKAFVSGCATNFYAVTFDGKAYATGRNNVGQLADGTTTDRNTWKHISSLTNVVDIGGGGDCIAACLSDGTVYAWGSNSSGQLGQDNTTNSSTPLQVKGVGGSGYLTNISAVGGGASTMFYITSAGALYACGNGGDGQLGQDNTSNSSTPVQVKGVGGTGYLTNIIKAEGANADNAVIVLSSTGTVYAWGWNGYGQAGLGNTTEYHTPQIMQDTTGSSNLTNIVDIASTAGGFNIMLSSLASGGYVYGAGYGGQGQLGDGGTSNRSTIVQMKGVGGTGFIENIVDVDAGGHFTIMCDSSGYVYCVGLNGRGQLGDGSTSQRLTPVKVKGVGGTGYLENIIKVHADDETALALSSTGKLYGWGRNNYGNIGDGTGTERHTPVEVPLTLFDVSPSLTFDTYNKLTINDITPTSSTLKYESNTYDIGTATNVYIKDVGTYTAEIKNATDFAFTSNVSSGTIKTIEPVINGAYGFGHALTYDGKLYGWGRNGEGESGISPDSPENWSSVPTATLAVKNPNSTGTFQGEIVSIWKQSNRGLSRWAKTRDGRIWLTGDRNSYCTPFDWDAAPAGAASSNSGDLKNFTDVSIYFGDHTQTSNSVVWASGSERATQVLMENGDVWSYGDDSGAAGVLGQGASPTNDHTPRKLSGISNVTKIVYNGDFVVALDSSNVVWMWGGNAIGSSDNGWGRYNVPTNIMGTGTANLTSLLVSGETVTDIENGSYSMFVITSLGTVYATGHNASGQLGQGNTTAKSSSDGWVKISYFTTKSITVNKLYTGNENPHVFADTSDGWYCWGENSTGELGLGDTTDKSTPVKFTHVSNIKVFGTVTNGCYAITEDGKYYAWGEGQLYTRGDNDTGDISYPKYIDTLPNILAPSFEFDGYDKVFVGGTFVYEFYVSVKAAGSSGLHYVNINQLSSSTMTLKSNMVTVHVPSGGNGVDSMFDGSNSTYISIDDPNHEVGTKLWTLVTNKELADLTFVADRPVYMPGWKITCNGKIVLNDTTNGSTSTTPSPATFIKSLSSSGSMKFTKGTTTYDAGKASIITVPDTGTYDAQLKKSGVFTLKSATVPATKASGLYTWAFHHGNFDNAYGDGDILTARDNGRFYADTPAFTSTSIGTITPGPGTSNIFGFPLTSSIPSASDYSDVSTITQGAHCEINSGSLKATNSSSSANDRTLYFHTAADYEEFSVTFDFNLSETGSDTGVFFSAEDTASDMRVEVQKSASNTIRAEIQSSLQPDFTQTSGFSDWAKLTLECFNKTSSRSGRVKIYINDDLKLDQEATTWTTSDLKFKYFTLVGGRPDGRWALPNARMKNFKFYNHRLYDTVSSTTYTFAPPSGGLTANVMMVAGGGGGGGRYEGGGGGAGGLVYTAGTSLASGATKTIVVGNGATGGVGDGGVGANGNDTTFTGLTTANLGGGGGSQNNTMYTGTAGSGGGGNGGDGSTYGANNGSNGTAGQGNAGGDGASPSMEGGGGGGAGGVGADASSGNAGDGGIGKFFGTGSSFTNFGDEYGDGGWFAGGGGGGNRNETETIPGGRGGGGYGQSYEGYMAKGGSQHAMEHTGGGGGGAGTYARDKHSSSDVKGHGGRGGSGIVLIQTNVAPPNGANTAVVQVGNPRRRSSPPAVDDMGSEVNRWYIIDSADRPFPTNGYQTHWYMDPISGNGSTEPSSGSFTVQKRADGSTSNVWYQSSGSYMYNDGVKMHQSVDAVFMPVEASQRYDVILSIGSNWNHDVQFEMAADGTARLTRDDDVDTLLQAGTIKCFTVGKWHHVALTVDTGGNAVGYVNGYPVVSATYTSAVAVGSRSEPVNMRTGVTPGVSFRKFLYYELSLYNFHMTPKQVHQRAAEVGCGPKLEYDGLNTLKILNTEPGSTVRLFTSNVADTSNVFIVADPAAGEYTIPESGKYYAEIKGTDTFTITRPLTVSDDVFPLYQYPPTDGTTSSLTQSASDNTWNTWTISGAANGNGQYQCKADLPSGTTSANNHYNFLRNNVGSTEQWQTSINNTYPIALSIQLPSAKKIRKYRMFPLDHNNPNGSGTSATPGTSTDPTLPGNGGDDATKRPKSWVFKGSNDGTSWTDLDTVTNKPISIYGDLYSIDSPASYQYYQVSITANNGGNKLLLGDIQLWGDA